MTVFSLFSASTQGFAFKLSRLEIDDSELTSHPIPIVSWNRSGVVNTYPKPCQGEANQAKTSSRFVGIGTNWNKIRVESGGK